MNLILLIHFSKKSDKNFSSVSEKYFVNKIDFFKASLLQKIALVNRFFYSTEAKEKLDFLVRIENPDVAHIHLYKGDLTPSILQVLKKRKIPVKI